MSESPDMAVTVTYTIVDQVVPLLGELIPAATGLVARRIGLGSHGGHCCLECGGAHPDPAAILHSSVCRVGEVLRVLKAIAICGDDLAPNPSPERNQQEEVCRDAGADVEERKPLPDFVSIVDRTMAKHGFVAPELYYEPWRLDESSGDVHNAEGEIVVDPYGSTVSIDAESVYMRRIVACVNICEGLPTADLERIAITRVHDDEPKAGAR